MKAGSADLAAAILRGEHILSHKLTHDWDNDGVDASIDDITKFVSGVEVSQELSTQLPEATRVIEGAAAAELVATLERGNITGYGVTVEYKATTTASSGSSQSSLVSIARPSGAVVGDMVFLFIANAGTTNILRMPDSYNVDDWYAFMIRGDAIFSPFDKVNGFGFTRRIAANEPTTYTMQFEKGETWAAACVLIGNPGAVGVVDIVTKGQDNDSTITFTTLTNQPVTTPRAGCLILSGFAASLVSTTGTWTPNGDDTEIADITTTRVGPNPNVVLGVQIDTDPAGDTSFEKSSTLSAATAPGVAFSLVISPMPAGDELQNAAWTFSEINEDGPYTGKVRTGRNMVWDMTYLTESGPEQVRMFTGKSLSQDGSSRARRHSISALDNRETMRPPVFYLPIVLAENLFNYPGETLPSYPGLELTWIISYLFRVCFSDLGEASGYTLTNPDQRGEIGDVGYFASPNARRSNLFHIPCHGSMEPYVSNVATLYAYTYTAGFRRRVVFDAGPYVASTEIAPFSGGHVTARYSSYFFNVVEDENLWDNNAQTSGRFEFMARFAVNSTGNNGLITITVANDNPGVRSVTATLTQNGAFNLTLISDTPVTRNVAGPTIPVDNNWHSYGVHWDSRTGAVTFIIDSTTTSTTFATWGNVAISSENVELTLYCTNGAQLAEVHVDKGILITSSSTQIDIVTFATPWLFPNFVPNAFIDKSDMWLDATYFLDPSIDTWEFLQELARVSFSAIYFDAYGYPHWRNGRSDSSVEGQTQVRELTSEDSLMDLDYTSGIAQIATTVYVDYTPVELVIDGIYYMVPGGTKVPAGGTVVLSYIGPGPFVPNTTFLDNYTGANTAADGSGTQYAGASGVTYTFQANGTGGVGSLTLTNLVGIDLWMVDATGQPSFSVTASWLQPSSTQTNPVLATDIDAIRKYRTQVLSIAASPWRQRKDTSQALANQLVSDLATPRPILRNMRIPGDARLELGDMAAIVDVNGIGLDSPYRLIGITSRFQPTTGFVQNITARRAALVAYWDIDYWDSEAIWG